jgi:hypothetical protein
LKKLKALKRFNAYSVFSIVSLVILVISAAPVRIEAQSTSEEDLATDVLGMTSYTFDFVGNEKVSIDHDTKVDEQALGKKVADLNEFYAKLTKQVEEKRARQYEVNKLVKFLKGQRSPIATDYYADIIIETSMRSGVDYKIIVAISGQESGFCKANYKKYNCFGYLNDVQYSGFEEALHTLIPKIANQYVKVYGTDFYAFAKAYGVHNVEYQAPRTAGFYYQLAAMK